MSLGQDNERENEKETRPFTTYKKKYKKTIKEGEEEMKPIRVIENYWSKLLCSILNISALTFYNYILLGCYENRYETLLQETTHFFQNRTILWYIRNIFKKLLRKEK